jgi:hypothetical protein
MCFKKSPKPAHELAIQRTAKNKIVQTNGLAQIHLIWASHVSHHEPPRWSVRTAESNRHCSLFTGRPSTQAARVFGRRSPRPGPVPGNHLRLFPYPTSQRRPQMMQQQPPPPPQQPPPQSGGEFYRGAPMRQLSAASSTNLLPDYATHPAPPQQQQQQQHQPPYDGNLGPYHSSM